MSLFSGMTEKLMVYARTTETDTWALVTEARIACRVERLNAAGARRESGNVSEPDVTHIARTVAENWLAGGQRVKLVSDDTEYVVRWVRRHARPGPGHSAVGLAEVKAVL